MPILDLHGYYVHEAWEEFKKFIDDSKDMKYVTVITGKGKMQEEFQHWVDTNPKLKSCELLPTGGAYKVYYNKNRGESSSININRT